MWSQFNVKALSGKDASGKVDAFPKVFEFESKKKFGITGDFHILEEDGKERKPQPKPDDKEYTLDWYTPAFAYFIKI